MEYYWNPLKKTKPKEDQQINRTRTLKTGRILDYNYIIC